MNARVAGLPAAALVLVAGVLGVQVAQGGGDFEPLASADPCQPREVSSRAEGIDGLSERLVLLGIDGAACRLHVSREALTLRLADPGPLPDAELEAFRDGLQDAVARMKKDGSLPQASVLVEEALDAMDLNGLLKAAIRALPDSVVNGVLKTDDVLRRTIDDLDLRALVANLDDQADLERQVQVAVEQAVEDSLRQRVKDLL